MAGNMILKLYSDDFVAAFVPYCHTCFQKNWWSKFALGDMCVPNTGVQACHFRDAFLIPAWECILVCLCVFLKALDTLFSEF